MSTVSRLLRPTLFKNVSIYSVNAVHISSLYPFTTIVPKDQKIHRLEKGHSIKTTSANKSITEAAKIMIDQRIGALLVVDEKDENEFVGVVTERDCMRAMSKNESELIKCSIKDIMTSNQDVITAKSNISSEECFKIMLKNNIRHLPLVDEKFIVCRLLSIKDVAASMISSNGQKVHKTEDGAEYCTWRARNS